MKQKVTRESLSFKKKINFYWKTLFNIKKKTLLDFLPHDAWYLGVAEGPEVGTVVPLGYHNKIHPGRLQSHSRSHHLQLDLDKN